MKWLIRPKRHDDESMSGYLCRIAWENGIDSSSIFRAVTRSATNITGAAPAMLQPAAYDGMEPRHTLVGLQRICPICLKVAPYLRAAWDHALLCNCLKHGVELIDSCPACGTILRRAPGRIACCACGYYFHQASAKAVVPTSLEHLLAHRLGLPDTATPDGVLSNICGLSASELVKLILLLGTFDPVEPRQKPRKVALKMGTMNSRRIMSMASILLTGWPENFDQVLSETYHRHPANTTVTAVFGRFYLSIYRDLQGASFDFVRNAFDSWVAREWKGFLTERHRRLTRQTRTNKRVISITALKKIRGINGGELEALVASGKLRGSTRTLPSGKKSTTIELHQDDLLTSLTSHYDLTQVSKILRMPRRRLRALLEAKVLKGFHTKERSKWKIPLVELEQLFAAIQSLRLYDESRAEEYMTVDKLCRFYLSKGDLFADVFSALLRGDLDCRRLPNVKELGVRGILISKKSFHIWQMQNSQGLSVPEVATRLNIKQEVAYHLIRHRILHSTERGRLGAIVIESDLKHFHAKYVWARDLAIEAKTSPKNIIGLMKAAGLDPVTGPDIDGCRQYLFLQKDVMKSGLALTTRRN